MANLDQLMKSALSEVLIALNVDAGSLHLINEEHSQVDLRAAEGLPREYLKHFETLSLDNPMVKAILKAGKALATVELACQDKDAWQLQNECGIERIVSVPLRCQSSIKGFINIPVPLLRTIKQGDLYFLDSISKHLGTIIEIERLNRQLIKMPSPSASKAEPVYHELRA